MTKYYTTFAPEFLCNFITWLYFRITLSEKYHHHVFSKKVHQLFQHVIDQRNKYGGKHVADVDLFNFKQVKADGHDQKAADTGHLIDDRRN